MCVMSDQVKLLKEAHIKLDKIKPSSYNFELATARWNETTPVTFYGVNKVVDVEIVRVMCHINLKLAIFKLRSGNLCSKESKTLISWLKRVLIYNSFDPVDEAEQIITAFMNVFLIKPIKLYIQDMMNMNCTGYIINSSIEENMKQCSFIHCEGQISIGSCGIIPVDLTNIRYDRSKGRAILNMKTSIMRDPIIPINMFNQAITVNGMLAMFTRRRATLGFRDMVLPEDDMEYVSVQSINFEKSYILDNKTFDLVSVLCYETIDVVGTCTTDRKTVGGYFALVKSENDDNWIKYSPSSFNNPEGIDKFCNDYITIIQKDNAEVPREDILINTTDNTRDFKLQHIPIEREIKSDFFAKFNEGYMDSRLLNITSDEAMIDIQTSSCLLIYAEDYATYDANMYNGRFLI